eukprot:CAMPEP_0118956168 /NCGR_PEP_ID=MMETSP1169-20130426/61240_1 /TAXON_ID=36882 /ORGANISM="Pyramimonas obovata, Strain CCMP722" /LENGTH=214 /DNA_ID=CAMNT_0006904149 /DNA_START=177 /DNA_END=818 /DNA_ORIENTATION=+
MRGPGPPPPAMAAQHPQIAAMTNNTGCLLMDFRGLDTGGAEFPVHGWTLRASNVVDGVTAGDLANDFGTFGQVECVCIRQKGLAYVNMVRELDAESARAGMDRFKAGGSPLTVDYEVDLQKGNAAKTGSPKPAPRIMPPNLQAPVQAKGAAVKILGIPPQEIPEQLAAIITTHGPLEGMKVNEQEPSVTLQFGKPEVAKSAHAVLQKAARRGWR